MDHDSARRFAAEWANHWNEHDLDSMLDHFAETVTFTSPVATQIMSGSDGVIRGKAALKEYWSEGLRRIPDLHFQVLGVYAGVNTVVINYRNQRGGLVCEVLRFDGDVVVEGHGTYADPDNPAGARPE